MVLSGRQMVGHTKQYNKQKVYSGKYKSTKKRERRRRKTNDVRGDQEGVVRGQEYWRVEGASIAAVFVFCVRE